MSCIFRQSQPRDNARELYPTQVRTRRSELQDEVGIEINSRTGPGVCARIPGSTNEFVWERNQARTIVYHNRHWALLRNLRVEFLQRAPVVRKNTGEVPGRDDDGGVCSRGRTFLTKHDRFPRATATGTYNDGNVQEALPVECSARRMDDRRTLATREVKSLPHRACEKWAHPGQRQIYHVLFERLQICVPPERVSATEHKSDAEVHTEVLALWEKESGQGSNDARG